MQTEGKPETLVEMKIDHRELADSRFEVTLTFHITMKLQQQTALRCEVQQAGIFRISDCPADQRRALLEGYCPGILHPYARKVIADLVWNAGFLPITLPPIDFEQARRQREKNAPASSTTQAATETAQISSPQSSSLICYFNHSRKLTMKSLEQSNLSALNSTDSLSALNHSTAGLSALLAAKGWSDLSPEIYAAESADQAKEQRLKDALQSYALQPDAHHGWELLNLLREAEAELQTQYAYAKKQQAFYQAQAEQEAKSGDGVIADWTQWLWHGVQDFFGSSSEALVEKYARMAAEYQRQQAELSSWTAALQQELLIDSTSSPEEDQPLPESTEE